MILNHFLLFFEGQSKFIYCSKFNTANIRSKFAQIDIFLNELSLTCHPPISAICVQETWLSEEDDSSHFNLNGYNCISKGKTCSQKGGLIIYLNENFTYKTIDIPEPSTLWESQVIEISSPALSEKVILGNFYRRPKENVADHKQFIDELSPILLYLESLNAEVILAGDFNINLLNIKNKDTASNFFNTITAHGFFPEITLPTRFTDRTGTLIDNFFYKVSEISLKSSPGILIDKFSDHQPYFTSFDLKPLHDSPPKFITISKHSPEALINFGNELESCDLIDKIDISLGGNPNDNYTKLRDILIKLKEKHLPNKTIKFNKQKHKKTPRITRSIIKSINLKNRLYNLLRVTPTNSLHYTTLKTNLQNYNKILKSSIRLAKKHYYSSNLQKCKGDIKQRWSTINQLLCKKGEKNKHS